MFEENWDEPDSVQVTPQVTCTQESKNENFKNFRSLSEKHGDRYKQVGKYSYSPSKYENTKINKSSGNETVMRVESTKVGLIIGKQGSKIKEIIEKSGAKIKIGKVCKDDNYLTEIILFGDEDSKQKCKEMINEIIRGNQFAANKIFTANSNSNDLNSVPIIDWDAINSRAEIEEKKKWMNCFPIKKNFYHEDSMVAAMTKEEVEAFRIKNNNIVVKNLLGTEEKILNPVQTFAQAFKHYPEIMKEIEKQGFEAPSPIQCQSWPILLSGQDLIGIAQTGTGKTLAFLLPALIHIDGQDIPKAEKAGPSVLIIAPTRELALQIESEVNKYSYKGIKCVCVYGGGNRREQMKIVAEGVEIIIATPGRLNDLVEANTINLSFITYLVLDEADRMLDMGFEPQIRKVLLDIRPDRQSVMTSATWPPSVENLALRYMSNPVKVYVGSLDLATVCSVTQKVLIIEEESKKNYLMDILRNLKDDDKIIVFVGKKKCADELSCDVSLNGIICQCIHGDREQMDREQALADLKTGAVNILIATDVASRGLDICDVTKVLNYDFPKNIEEYVHRVGRTGRAGKTGESLTFFTKYDWAHAGELIKILERANQSVPEELYGMRTRFQQMLQKRSEEKSFNQKFDRNGRRSTNNWY